MAWRCWTVLLAFVVAGRAASAQGGAGRAASDGLTAFARSKAETLLRDRLPCLGCHTLGGKGDEPNARAQAIARTGSGQ